MGKLKCGQSEVLIKGNGFIKLFDWIYDQPGKQNCQVLKLGLVSSWARVDILTETAYVFPLHVCQVSYFLP